MLKKTFQLFISNIGNVFLSFLTVVITARFLGLDGRGEISLFAADLAWLQLLSGIVGAGSIYHLISKFNINNIFYAATIWIVISNAIAVFALVLIMDYQLNNGLMLLFCAVFSSLFLLLLTIVFAKKSHRIFYWLRTLQPLIFLTGLLVLYFLNLLSVAVYFKFLTATYFIMLLLVMFVLKDQLYKPLESREIKAVFSAAFYNGLLNQSANLIQLVNYRFGLFMLAKNVSVAAAGLFGMLGIFSEIIWLYSAGSSAVIAREVVKKTTITTMNYPIKTTLKSTFLVTTIIFAILFFTPDIFYNILLGPDFIQVKTLLIHLFPGVILFSMTKVLANYFAATGNVKLNLQSSLLGAVFVVFLSILLIPKLKIEGALIAQNIALTIVSFATGLFYYFSYQNDETSA